MRSASVIPLLLLAAVFCIVPAGADVSLDILQPSEHETVFAEMRDLYVYGTFFNAGDSADVRVRMYDPDGVLIRTLQSHVDSTGETSASSVDMTMIPEKQQWGGILAPEGITEPYGHANGANKVLVSKKWGYYLAYVQGGVTRTDSGMYFEAYENGELHPYSRDFTAGVYRIVVDVLDADGNNLQFTNGDGELADSIERTVSFGLTHASLGMFRPGENRDNVVSYARENGLRSYIDWFPGYFQIPDGSAGYQIPALWQPNNGIEVVNDLGSTILDTPASAENTLIIYNIGSSSTTLQVELAQILRAGLEDSDKTTYTYYNTGEICYTWVDRVTGEEKTCCGVLTAYPDTSAEDFRVIYTRADRSSEPIPDNTVSLLPNLTKTIDVTPYEVTVSPGEYLAFYGLTRPIRTTLTDAGTPYRYTVDDQIMRFTYTAGETLYEFDGLLNRVFVNPDGSLFTVAQTNYEFGHVFTAEQTAEMPVGTTVYTVRGYDAAGRYVEDTNASITITVLPKAAFPQDPVLPIAILLAVLATSAVIVVIRKL